MFATPRNTILIVDASLALQSTLRASFHADGHHTIPATSVADALVALSACDIDLVLADGDGVLGPAGWAGLDALLAAANPVPVVLISTLGAIPFAGYHGRGFAGLVARPGDLDDLRTSLAPFLAADAAQADPPFAAVAGGAALVGAR